MARNNNDAKDTAAADNLRNKSSILTYGSDTSLTDEDRQLKAVVQQVIGETKDKLGERTNGKPLNYFNEINFGNAFNELFTSNKNKDDKKENTNVNLKKYMSEKDNINVGAILAEESTRTLLFNNYRIIKQHIPECAQALKLFKDNIISPDDYTKLLFNISYEQTVSKEIKDDIDEKLDKLTIKYEIEDKADQIVDEALLLGESYCAVLSLEDELGTMLNDPIMRKNGTTNVLNEATMRLYDPNVIDAKILKEDIKVGKDELSALSEWYQPAKEGEQLTEKIAQDIVADCINYNVVIGSPMELLLERAEADEDMKKNDPENLEKGYSGKDIPEKDKKEKSPKKAKGDDDPLYVNGSVLRRLDPSRVVELKIDNACYGFLYAEEIANNIPQSTYLGTATGRDAKGAMNVAANNTLTGTPTYKPTNGGAADQLGVGEQKLKLITDLFINQISKKIDKDFIRKNKKFKDFVYDLVRQDYIIKKGLKLTYFKPDEVIKFECPAVYRDITFFAKLYLSILTNNLLIKLGRAHDKRIFYVNVGSDAQYEQAIQSVIEDIKTKDYKMENLNDFNTLLNLSPGRFDDYFMPQINGDKPVEIDTLQGMDVDMNNDFVEYLKNSMMSGMGCPRNLIDVTSDVDFARSVSAMNANFVRTVIKYQKQFTAPFTRMYQILFKNEYRYSNTAEDQDGLKNINIDKIKVSFPSPATLVMTGMSEQIQVADANAEFIAAQYFPPLQDGSNEDKRLRFKTAVTKELLPGIDWDKFNEMKEKFDLDNAEEVVKARDQQQPMMPQDPMMGNGGMGMPY